MNIKNMMFTILTIGIVASIPLIADEPNNKHTFRDDLEVSIKTGIIIGALYATANVKTGAVVISALGTGGLAAAAVMAPLICISLITAINEKNKLNEKKESPKKA